MKPQYKWHERIVLALHRTLGKVVDHIDHLEVNRRKALSLSSGSVIRCRCAKCLRVNQEGRLWSIVSYDSDCDQYKAFAADGVKTDLFCNVQKVDRDWFEDGKFEVVTTS